MNSDSKKGSLGIIVSVGINDEIGREGDLCWHISDDLKRFRQLTMGGAVIMGRKTWESLPVKPLKGRLNIVVSRNADIAEAAVARSLEEALRLAEEKKTFIIGGESLYREAFPLADTLEITRIEAADPMADRFFPSISSEEWEQTEISPRQVSPDGLPYRFITYRRRP